MNGKQLTEEEDEGEISNYEGISVVICANKIFNSLEVKKKWPKDISSCCLFIYQ